MTDEHHDSALSDVPSALNMHLGDQRTSRVDGRKRSQLRFVLNFSRHAVSAENRHRSLRHLVEILDETRAFRLERFDDMTIVNNLVAHVDWSAILGQRPLDDIDGADNPCAKPAWLGKNDLHHAYPLAKASTGPAKPPISGYPKSASRDEFPNGTYTRQHMSRQETRCPSLTAS